MPGVEIRERGVATSRDRGHGIGDRRVLGEQLVLVAALRDDVGIELLACRGEPSQGVRARAAPGATPRAAGRCRHRAVLSLASGPGRAGPSPIPNGSGTGTGSPGNPMRGDRAAVAGCLMTAEAGVAVVRQAPRAPGPGPRAPGGLASAAGAVTGSRPWSRRHMAHSVAGWTAGTATYGARTGEAGSCRPWRRRAAGRGRRVSRRRARAALREPAQRLGAGPVEPRDRHAPSKTVATAVLGPRGLEPSSWQSGGGLQRQRRDTGEGVR
jgi:hypothetical protein